MASITLPGLQYIERPTTFKQAPHRLTSIVPVRAADSHDILSGVTYEVDACGETTTSIDWDNYDDCIRTAAKEFDEGLLFVESITGPLSLLAALKCRPGAIGGGDFDDYRARAIRRLARLESRYLEDTLWAWIDDEGTSSTGGTGAEATIAALLGAHIGDVNNPVLHLSAKNAASVVRSIDDYEDVFGVKVVISPGYADNRIALTGDIAIWGGETAVNAVPQTEHNYIMALAERMYVMAVECEPYYAAVA